MGNNVVMFPAHKARKPKTNLAVKQTEEQAKKIKEDLFIEQLTEEFTLDFIHVLQENAVNMKGETVLRDLAVVIESIKSLIKRDFKQKHPMQTITDVISKITTLPNGKKVTDMNYNKVFVSKTPPKVDK
jgi:hypothetical protein